MNKVQTFDTTVNHSLIYIWINSISAEIWIHKKRKILFDYEFASINSNNNCIGNRKINRRTKKNKKEGGQKRNQRKTRMWGKNQKNQKEKRKNPTRKRKWRR